MANSRREKREQAELHLGQCARAGPSATRSDWEWRCWTICRRSRRRRRYGCRSRQRFRSSRRAQRPVVRRWRLGLRRSRGAGLIGVAYWMRHARSGTRWEVVRLDGSPPVGAKHIRDAGQIGAGEWIETDSGSSATVKVGHDWLGRGRAEYTGARGDGAPGEHRLALARGEIRAKISAPPRLFFVDTASRHGRRSGLRVHAEHGRGRLRPAARHQGLGVVSMEGTGVAGAGRRECRTRPRVGPGIPYFDDAPESLKQALERLRFRKSRERVAERHSCRGSRPRYAHALASAFARGRRRSGAGVRSHRRADTRPGRRFARAGAPSGS